MLHPPLVSSIAPYPIEVAQACHKDTAMQFANAAQIDESDRRKISAYKAIIAVQTLRNFRAVLWIYSGMKNVFGSYTSNELAKMNAFLLFKNVCHFCAFFFGPIGRDEALRRDHRRPPGQAASATPCPCSVREIPGQCDG